MRFSGSFDFSPKGAGGGCPGSVTWALILVLLGCALAFRAPGLSAQAQERRILDLTMEQMVDLAMSSSFRVRQLNLEVQRERYNLQANQARLRSSVNMDLTVPAYSLTSEPKWNSDLQKNQIVRENTRRWEGELSIRQPVILFGYPTDGYLSFNNRMYRYTQIDDAGDSGTDFYNRYYVRYTQPLFQPNGLKNDLEQAELSLEGSQLEFYDDVIGIVDNVSETYYDLFEEFFTLTIRRELVADMERALGLAQDWAGADSTRAIEVDQIQVELANAREQVQSSESSIRLGSSSVKRELGLLETDSIFVEPQFRLDPVSIDMDEAVRYAIELTPRMRQLDISLRNSEIRLEETKSRGGFRMDLSMSYGRERRDEIFDKLWVDNDNSYTVNVDAYIPIWDWGERKARIASSEIGIQQTRLRMEEVELQIVSGVRNEVLNVQDRERRTMAMEDNMELARGVTETSFQRYQNGAISAVDLILSLRREMDTKENFLDAYLGWRSSLRRLWEMTYFDFEQGMPVLERFRVDGSLNGNGLGSLKPSL